MVEALLLAPGAGTGRDHGCLVALDREVSRLGVVVERMDFPYRLAGRKAPDRPPVLVAAVVEAAEALAAAAGCELAGVALGGRSMGGRMCSVAVAEGLPAAGLALISYPLHPPGRPERLRAEHFPDLRVPCLFVSGTRDPFAAPEELGSAAGAIPGPVSMQWVQGGDHGLRRRDEEVAAAVVSWLESVG